MEWLTAMKKSIGFMEEHLYDDISADDVASEVFMSPFYFQRGFKILTGITPAEYIRNRRLYLAALDVLGGKEKVIARRHPRCPSIGLCSLRSANFALIVATETPSLEASA